MNTLGIPKEEFLQAIQDTLGKSERKPATLYPPITEELSQLEERVLSLRQKLAAKEDELIERLTSVAPSMGWKLYRASTSEDALDYICGLVDSMGAGLIVRSDQDIFQEVPLDPSLTAKGVQVSIIAQDSDHSQEELRREMAQAEIGVTGVDYAIAETGSVVLIPRRRLSRLVSLVPPVHVAIVRPQEVLESLEDLFLLQRLAYYKGEMWNYVNFITGPSRTADIEQTMVVGVHGPKEAHMVLLGYKDGEAA